MITETNVVGEASEDCPCVCYRSKLHCPQCGRVNFYNVRALALSNRAGTLTRGYRCRSCGAEFRETSTCTAPQLVAQGAKRADLEVSRQQKHAVAHENSPEGIDGRRTVLQALRLLGKNEVADRKEAEWRTAGLEVD